MTAEQIVVYGLYKFCYLEDRTFQELNFTLEGKQSNTTFISDLVADSGQNTYMLLFLFIAPYSLHVSFCHTHTEVGTRDILLLFVYYFESIRFCF